MFGVVYPVLSRDGGRSWHIDGPRFYRAAADAPDVTQRLIVTTDGTLVAWGRGGDFVKITTDLGRDWFEAGFPTGVYSVHSHGRAIIVRALGNSLPLGSRDGPFATWDYRSSDNGRRWRRARAEHPVRW